MYDSEPIALYQCVYYGWAISLVLGLICLVCGALIADDVSSLMLTVGIVLLAAVTPLLLLWRALMPRKWRRAVESGGLRRL